MHATEQAAQRAAQQLDEALYSTPTQTVAVGNELNLVLYYLHLDS
jgi:hypothetical protein